MTLTKAQTAQRRTVVDELGDIENDISKLDPKVQRAKELRAEIESWTAKTPASSPVSYSGLKYIAVCGERKNVRTVDAAGLREFMGDGFFEIATVALGAIDDVAKRLPKVLQFVSSSRSGKRSISTAPKAA